jgi:hypothetical protein
VPKPSAVSYPKANRPSIKTEWIATNKNKYLWLPFKNLHASFHAAAQQAKRNGNEALEDRLLTTAVMVFWSTSSKGFSNDLCAQMVRRIDLFGKGPMAALKLLADVVIRSAVTKIMPIVTPEMTSSNRYRRTAEAARNGNLSEAGAVLDDDSLRSNLGWEEMTSEAWGDADGGDPPGAPGPL